jgi:hypothetical protein
VQTTTDPKTSPSSREGNLNEVQYVGYAVLIGLGYGGATAGSGGKYLQRETLVSLESTTYPGRTDDVVRPVLEASGLVARVDFNLAFSPERIDSGNQEFGPETRQGDRRPHREMRTRRPISANSSKRS